MAAIRPTQRHHQPTALAAGFPVTAGQLSPQSAKVASLDHINDAYKNGYMAIYTHGSKMENRAGYSAFIPALGI